MEITEYTVEDEELGYMLSTYPIQKNVYTKSQFFALTDSRKVFATIVNIFSKYANTGNYKPN